MSRVERRSSADVVTGRAAPQISHVLRDEWFKNVHLGQVTVRDDGVRDNVAFEPSSVEVPLLVASIWPVRAKFGVVVGDNDDGSLREACEMAAFRTSVRAGATPQAKHGGIGVCAFTVAGSKLDGMGLANEQMAQIHVPCSLRGVLGKEDGP